MQATSSVTLGFIAMATKSQLNIAVSMAFEVKPQLSVKGFKLSQYARTVALDSMDSISEKTCINYATIAKKLCDKYGDKIGLYQFTATDVQLFANFLTSEVAAQGYTASLDDIAAFVDGKPSQKARRLAAIEQARLEAEAKATAEAQAKAAQEQASTLVDEAQAAKLAEEKAKAEKAEADAKAAQEEAARVKAEAEEREAKIRAEAEALAKKAEEQAAQAKAEADAKAEAERKERESVCITVKVDANGAPIIELDDNMNPAFLEEVAKLLKAQATAIRKQIKESLALAA